VHYDAKRGEGLRGRASARTGLRARDERIAAGHGDCIDCGLCMQVCPAGIDIRQGLQYRCISCGLCVDACDGIMDSMGYPRGLIRYDAETNLARPVPGKPRLHWKSLKVLGYGLFMAAASAYLLYSVARQSSYEGTINQIRQPLFVLLSDGQIRNRYEIRIINKAPAEQTFHIGVRGVPEAALDLGQLQDVVVKSGRSVVVPASIHLAPEQAAHVSEFGFVITPLGKPAEARVEAARFYSGQ
jgi:cytochrome c oxidase accessory protein FixG